MKAANGGIGMTDEQVKKYVQEVWVSLHCKLIVSVRFVDRYIPGYVFFGEGVRRGGRVEGRPAWEGRGLGITIDQDRRVLETEHF